MENQDHIHYQEKIKMELQQCTEYIKQLEERNKNLTNRNKQLEDGIWSLRGQLIDSPDYHEYSLLIVVIDNLLEDGRV